jgi:hypothetical protein
MTMALLQATGSGTERCITLLFLHLILGAFGKKITLNAPIYFVMSVSPHGTREPLN